MYRIIIIFVAVLLFIGCASRATESSNKQSETPSLRAFKPTAPPITLRDDQKRDYLRYHYWDGFDFSDSLYLHKSDSIQNLALFAQFIHIISDKTKDQAPIDTLMRKAAISRSMLDYFAWMAREVLYDPNSPLRNDELYIPILEAQIAAPFYNEYERISPQYELKMVSQNRVGQRANDFEYTTVNGKTERLHAIKAEYTLLFFYNMGCEMCRALQEEILTSPMLTEMSENGRLRVLALYPDRDVKGWAEYQERIPKAWINGYDNSQSIDNEGLYNLTAIPSLYLLDAKKRVMVKDGIDVAKIEEAIDRAL